MSIENLLTEFEKSDSKVKALNKEKSKIEKMKKETGRRDVDIANRKSIFILLIPVIYFLIILSTITDFEMNLSLSNLFSITDPLLEEKRKAIGFLIGSTSLLCMFFILLREKIVDILLKNPFGTSNSPLIMIPILLMALPLSLSLTLIATNGGLIVAIISFSFLVFLFVFIFYFVAYFKNLFKKKLNNNILLKDKEISKELKKESDKCKLLKTELITNPENMKQIIEKYHSSKTPSECLISLMNDFEREASKREKLKTKKERHEELYKVRFKESFEVEIENS
jgi:hypothetical protein